MSTTSTTVGFVAGAVVHWDETPTDLGIVYVEDNGHRTVLWFDAEYNCDSIDADGNTEWPLYPDKSKGQYSRGGALFSRRGKLLKRQTHHVVATGEVDRERLAAHHVEFKRFCTRGR
jgi:hypothetical protein